MSEQQVALLTQQVTDLQKSLSAIDKKVDGLNARVVKNEEVSRGRNARFFNIPKWNRDDLFDKFQRILVDGFKLSEAEAKDVQIDNIHPVGQHSFIVAFCRRIDLHMLFSKKSKLKGFKLPGCAKELSMQKDETPEERAQAKMALELIGKLRAAKIPGLTAKLRRVSDICVTKDGHSVSTTLKDFDITKYIPADEG